MRLSPVTYSNNNQKSQMNFKGKDPKFISDKAFAWMENANGVHQRAILGAASILTQPAIDLNNKKSDERTRKLSALKDTVKIVVGTTFGCAARAGMIKVADNMIIKNKDKFLKMIKKPKLNKEVKEILNDKDRTTKFKNNFGTILGIVAVVAADLLIDMPVAKYLIDVTSKKYGLVDAEPEQGNKQAAGGAHG